MMNRRPPQPLPIQAQEVAAVVKWYNPTKGFGFVQPVDGSPDAFLHVSVVSMAGHDSLPEGTRLTVDIAEGRRGPQVAAIRRIDEMGTPRPRAGGFGGASRGEPMEDVDGTVKFFNPEKGFGFVAPDDGGKDIYVSLRTLQRTGLSALAPNQRVRVSARMGEKGPMAERIEPL